MSLVDLILKRRSVRRYAKKRVAKEVLNKILEAGRQAPSADNVQPWHFIVLTDSSIKEKMSRGRYNIFVKDSAFTIVGCGYVGDADGRRWSTIDTTIALQNMVIAAWVQGVGSCWIGDFQEEEAKKLLGIPENWKIVALVSFGYPTDQPRERQKKPLEEIIGCNKF
ncbi:MAG: nitroreductase family protein [Candidatus Bathyarchaeota archaeon]|nr:nitroreductase family protein [Candidatus Bathyarchaeota archaeon]